jgi:hypothetical protein
MPNIRQWINKLYYTPKIPRNLVNLDFYVSRLNAGQPFSFSRFGDGEWSAMLGKAGANCDGHEYFPEMAKRLRDAVITSSDYFYSIQNFAIKNMGAQIYRFLKKNKVCLTWYNSDVFHYANIAGELNPLVKALRTKNVVMVGPSYLRKISSMLFEYKEYIEIPGNNCYSAIDKIESDVLSFGKGKTGYVYALSASMAANCIIDDCFKELGKTNWMIDFGSLWDIYAGVKSRSVYNNEGWEEKIKRNCAD